MSQSRPRAVVADDSHFMRSVISDILEAGGIDVVEEARNGREAVEAVADQGPDVVTMDVEMPEMDGIEAVERIMSEHPTPIVMLSAHTDENADVTFEALDKGAVDFFTKPGGEVSMEMSRLEDQLVEMVSSVAAADVSGDTGGPTVETDTGTAVETERSTVAPSAVSGTPSSATDSSTAARSQQYADHPTLVIGSSTGGPKMVEQVLCELPRGAGFAVLVVQHMPDGFTERFATRLDTQSEYDVREASDGDRVGSGEALVAPGDRHLVVSNYHAGRLRVKLSDDAPVNSVRPSVDVTMRSAAETVTDPLVGVILTGMGEDGAEGMVAIDAADGHTIAQDEETSAVFGMPKRAIETGTVEDVLPVGEIPARILETATREVT